jgi:peroxiredoxin
MATHKQQKERTRQEGLKRQAETRSGQRARRLRLQVAGAVTLAVVALGAIFLVNSLGGSGKAKQGKAGEFAFEVGDPGPGEKAPPIVLPSTDGRTFDLASQRGKTVLLYFQEGLMCQPCFDQIKDIERDMAPLRALGIDRIVSITTDPLDQLQVKVRDDGISTPVLSDPDLAVSKDYSANQYGMMGTSRDGHSFIVVGPDGRIRWRADYGGPPNFTMYVPPSNLVADIRDGLRQERRGG